MKIIKLKINNIINMLEKIIQIEIPLIPLISIIIFTIIGIIHSLKYIKNQILNPENPKMNNPPHNSILSLMKNTPLIYIKHNHK